MSIAERSQFEDVAILLHRWEHACLGLSMPRFEDVAVGNLGQIASDLALVELFENDHLRLINCGERLCQTLHISRTAASLDHVSLNFQTALQKGVKQALNSKQPVFETTRFTQMGFAGTCELLFLPLMWRDRLLISVFGRQRRETQDILETIYGATSEGMLVLAPSGDDVKPEFQIMSINCAAAGFLNVDVENVLWKNIGDLLTPLEETALSEHFSNVLKTGKPEQFEIPHQTIQGEMQYFQVCVTPVTNLLVVNVSNITAIKEREMSLEVMFEGNPIPHLLYDPETLLFLRVNEAAVQHYGYSRAEMLRMSVLDLNAPDQGERVRGAARQPLKAAGRQSHATHFTKDGRCIDVIVFTRALSINGQTAVLSSIIDVTEQRRSEARIVHMAHHDHLTTLPNRMFFLDRLDKALAHIRRSSDQIAIHCIDLDDFKKVNDTLGHPIGDKLLNQVSARLSAHVRDEDFVARLGGDEFAIIQTGIQTKEDAAVLAERIVAVLGAPYLIDGNDVVIGASVGVACAPKDSLHPDDLLKRADIALYRAKADGKNLFHFFEPGMDAGLQRRRSLEIDLRLALQNGELTLSYQPLIDIKDCRIVACEALLRWQHPIRGAISPSEFIPLAEETGLLGPIGDFVLRKACQEAVHWPDGIKVAVNLSPVQFRNRAVIASIHGALAISGLPAQQLEVEITESILLADSEINRTVLVDIRKMGVSIAMDDFGTGYSSLSYLRSFPFDKIKIDRSFVADVAENAESEAIIRAITMLGQTLNIPTLAEGIETQEQLEIVRRAGCLHAQGFLFSPAVPSAEIRAFLATQPWLTTPSLAIAGKSEGATRQRA